MSLLCCFCSSFDISQRVMSLKFLCRYVHWVFYLCMVGVLVKFPELLYIFVVLFVYGAAHVCTSYIIVPPLLILSQHPYVQEPVLYASSSTFDPIEWESSD